jgi:hypothetical protein
LSIAMTLTNIGVVEEITLPFKISKATLKGKMSFGSKALIGAVVLGFIGYMFILTLALGAIFGPDQEKGSAGFNWGMGLSILGLLIVYMVISPVSEKIERQMRHDSWPRQYQVAKELLGPWLAANGNLKDPEGVAYSLLSNRSARVNEDENSWNAFSIELAAYGWGMRNQQLRIWHWEAA